MACANGRTDFRETEGSANGCGYATSRTVARREKLMCDERTIREADEYLRRSGSLSRREFGALSVGAGLAMLLPRAANALEVTAANVEVTTPDGTADGHFVHPASGAHPGVLIWPDALGLRPAFEQMGRRLAESGYAVLVVNPYYRTERAPVLPEGASFRDEATRKKIFPLMRSLSPETNVTDAKAFVGFLDGQGAVAGDRKMGTMGYCMGGSMTMRTAAAFPDRVGAGASFHGGRLVTDAPDSPHLLVDKMRGALPLRDRGERRREGPPRPRTCSARFLPPPVCRRRSRCTRAPCTAGARRIPPSTTRRRRNVPGAGCWLSSRPPSPDASATGAARAGRPRRGTRSDAGSLGYPLSWRATTRTTRTANHRRQATDAHHRRRQPARPDEARPPRRRRRRAERRPGRRRPGALEPERRRHARGLPPAPVREGDPRRHLRADRLAGDPRRDPDDRPRLRELDLRARRRQVRHGRRDRQGPRPERGDGQPGQGDAHRPGGRVRRDGRGQRHDRPRLGLRLRSRGSRRGAVRRPGAGPAHQPDRHRRPRRRRDPDGHGLRDDPDRRLQGQDRPVEGGGGGVGLAWSTGTGIRPPIPPATRRAEA